LKRAETVSADSLANQELRADQNWRWPDRGRAERCSKRSSIQEPEQMQTAALQRGEAEGRPWQDPDPQRGREIVHSLRAKRQRLQGLGAQLGPHLATV